jgi:hypothetical protein
VKAQPIAQAADDPSALKKITVRAAIRYAELHATAQDMAQNTVQGTTQDADSGL